MCLGVSGCILDTCFETQFEVAQQTHNQIFPTSLFAVACHVALLLPQNLVVPSRVEVASVEQVLRPVHAHKIAGCQLHHNSYEIIAVMYVCVTSQS